MGIDLLFITRALTKDARAEIEKRCGIKAGNILLGASHSHSSGPIGMAEPGDFDQGPARRAGSLLQQVRWAALLRWAGADPFRRAPDNLEEHFPIDPESEDWSAAADDAIWRGDAQLLKALHLNPTPEQAVELLKPTSYKHNVAQFKSPLASMPREKLNRLDRNSCEALEQLVGTWPDENFLTRTPNEKGNAEKLQCIELLLDAGARWNPPIEDLKSDRRYLMRHDAKYIVQVIRCAVDSALR